MRAGGPVTPTQLVYEEALIANKNNVVENVFPKIITNITLRQITCE